MPWLLTAVAVVVGLGWTGPGGWRPAASAARRRPGAGQSQCRPRCVVDRGVRDTVRAKLVRHRAAPCTRAGTSRGGQSALFGPAGVPSCTVKPGTKIFEIASSFQCSTIEGNGTTEAELRTCAEHMDAQTAPSVTVDGHAVPVKGVETGLMHIVLPADNIFGLPAGTTGLSVGHGWIALLDPLTPGTHTIVGSGSTVSFTTKIIVRTHR